MSGWLLRLIVPLIGSTLRWQVEDPAGFFVDPPGPPGLITFWHNRIFLMPFVFRKYWKRCQRNKVAALVSASKDGERLARALTVFGLVCVRGSSSRRGTTALREMIRLVNEGYDAAITPDGPRGPKYQVADGVVSLAQLTGAPIVPVSYRLSWKITLKSWDAFMIPLPFGRAMLHIAPPITVPRDADEQQRENKRLELETVLKSLSAP